MTLLVYGRENCVVEVPNQRLKSNPIGHMISLCFRFENQFSRNVFLLKISFICMKTNL